MRGHLHSLSLPCSRCGMRMRYGMPMGRSRSRHPAHLFCIVLRYFRPCLMPCTWIASRSRFGLRTIHISMISQSASRQLSFQHSRHACRWQLICCGCSWLRYRELYTRRSKALRLPKHRPVFMLGRTPSMRRMNSPLCMHSPASLLR